MKTAGTIIISSLLFLSACTSAPPSEPPSITPGTPAQVEHYDRLMIRRAVLARLRDPDSARFSPIERAAEQTNGDKVICGFVNARNGFGGYTGDTPYMAVMRSHLVAELALGVGRETDAALVTVCRQLGAQI